MKAATEDLITAERVTCADECGMAGCIIRVFHVPDRMAELSSHVITCPSKTMWAFFFFLHLLAAWLTYIFCVDRVISQLFFLDSIK